jgi:predicted nucleic acid-binding protein
VTTVPPVLFADASYYIALFSRPDEERERAVAWQRYLARGTHRIVTTEAVLWEWLNYFSLPARREGPIKVTCGSIPTG